MIRLKRIEAPKGMPATEDPVTNYLGVKINTAAEFQVYKKRVHSKAWHSIRAFYLASGETDDVAKSHAGVMAKNHVDRWAKLVKYS